MGIFDRLFGSKKQENTELLNMTLRQLRDQKMYFKVENDEQLDMTFGEWTALQKSKLPKEAKQPKYRNVHMVVDETLINANDAQGIIEPLWWSVSIYDGEEKYEQDLAPFTLPQRYIFAIQWYVAEVNNGGHDQFYYNSTGIVWEDALRGFEAIGAKKNADILKASADRLGGHPSKDRTERQEQMEKYEVEDEDLFEGLDDAYYNSEAEMYELLFAYVKANAQDFFFSGVVKIPE